MSHEIFWMVYGEGQGAPTAKHPDFGSAKREAQRLARNNPGIRFVVLAGVVAYIKRDVDEIMLDSTYHAILDEEIPF